MRIDKIRKFLKKWAYLKVQAECRSQIVEIGRNNLDNCIKNSV